MSLVLTNSSNSRSGPTNFHLWPYFGISSSLEKRERPIIWSSCGVCRYFPVVCMWLSIWTQPYACEKNVKIRGCLWTACRSCQPTVTGLWTFRRYNFQTGNRYIVINSLLRSKICQRSHTISVFVSKHTYYRHLRAFHNPNENLKTLLTFPDTEL